MIGAKIIMSMDLPKFTEEDIKEKRVVVRADLDVGGKIDISERRLNILVDLLEKISGTAKTITILGHRGRPEGKKQESLNLKQVSKTVEEMLSKKIGPAKMKDLEMHMMDNLRFNKGEEKNDEEYAKHLAEGYDVYINEAFAVSHRNHASVVSLPKFLKSFAGPHFIREIENLKKVVDSSQKPLVFVISGVKNGKVAILESLKNRADKVLVGGRLPDYIHDESPLRKDPKFVIANLIADKEDITVNSIEAFNKEIKKAGTIVLSGPLGKFEEGSHVQGTKQIFESIAGCSALKIAGGGETEEALNMLKLEGSFDWISVGGGAMLEFLSEGSLPGLEALIH